ncbi:MAG: transcriptional regulator [Acetobacter peroxydans]|jgi:hypothetical protein|nr:transcriptional regulator [Acetobacter peroxydans]
MTRIRITDRLKALRERAGYTIRDFARALGYGDKFSSYRTYETSYKKEELPLAMVKLMVPLLTGRGEPPITTAEVWNLAGLTTGEAVLGMSPGQHGRTDPAQINGFADRRPQRQPGFPRGMTGGLPEAPVATTQEDEPARSSLRQVSIPEYDVLTSAGPGSVPVLCAPQDGLKPIEHWSLPRGYISAFAESPEALAIIRVAGDSMEPDYQAGDRVLVDTAHHTPSPPGVYVLWDGFGLVLKRLELLPGMEEPRRVRIMSINPAYSTYELTLDEISINGRVVGKWTWK